MRTRDDNKQDAVFKAIIKLINEEGFVSTSMSKIAKEAGVSAATLYIYYENKEDMFRRTYVDVKKLMLAACRKGMHPDAPVKQSITLFCRNLLTFIHEHRDWFLFLEQAANSPLMEVSVYADLEEQMSPLVEVFERGKSEGILKDVPTVLLMGFCMYPIMQFSKIEDSFHEIQMDRIISMCWDAIKS